MNFWRVSPLIICASAILANLGCSSSAPVAAGDSRYVLKEEPTGAADVMKLKIDAKDQDNVVVVGRIGGSENPWSDGVAAFSIVDRSLVACNEKEGDNCPTPWDFCCQADVAKGTMRVKFIDDTGKVLKQDARQLLNLKELQTVVIKGKAVRDDSGNVTIAATGVHVRNN
jgi:hypothetical protein